jgi:putative nucleotidyltransferase with HDIG domain
MPMKRVLFVDDDAPVLEGLRLRLRPLRENWDMAFIDSAFGALDLLTQQPFDVIVTDMRMPRMDGAELLQIVRQRWPETVRIVLSGYSEMSQTVRLAPLAHQYLSKPCEPDQLENIVNRCLALQQLLREPALRSAVGHLRELPPVPETYSRLQAAMAVENVSVQEVANIVAHDTVIAAKVLQMVNSAFFRLPRKVTSIEQAVTYLGLVSVRNLVISAEVFAKALPSRGQRALNVECLQEHALRVACATQALTSDALVANDALLAALLHDIGYLVLAQEHATALEESVRLSTAEALPLDCAEVRVLGASHAEIGAYLLGLWGFSSTIVEAVAHHHAPQRVPQTSFDVLAALSVGHALTEPRESSAFRACTPHSEVDAHYLESVHAPFTWTDAQRRVMALASDGGLS